MAGSGPEMLVHVRDCPLVDPADRAKATAEHVSKNLSPRRDRAAARSQAYTAAAMSSQGALTPFPSIVQLQTIGGTPILFQAGSSTSPMTLSPIDIPNLAGPSGSTGGLSSAPITHSASPITASTSSWQNSPAPSPSPSVHSIQSLLGKRPDSPFDLDGSPVKRGRYRGSASRSVSRQPSISTAPPPPPPWETRQGEYESYLGWLTASQGWSLSWTENPVWIDFSGKFINPQAKNPSRYVLTSRIIPQEVESHRQSAKDACTGKPATVQCDGFTAQNKHHLVSFMITVNRKVRFEFVFILWLVLTCYSHTGLHCQDIRHLRRTQDCRVSSEDDTGGTRSRRRQVGCHSYCGYNGLQWRVSGSSGSHCA